MPDSITETQQGQTSGDELKESQSSEEKTDTESGAAGNSAVQVADGESKTKDNGANNDAVFPGLPGYSFFCHQKMREELSDHGTGSAQTWLANKIVWEIICYSDDQILSEMGRAVSDNCFLYYRSFLKQGCELFDSEFYSRYFQPLDTLMETGGYNRGALYICIKNQVRIEWGEKSLWGYDSFESYAPAYLEKTILLERFWDRPGKIGVSCLGIA